MARRERLHSVGQAGCVNFISSFILQLNKNFCIISLLRFTETEVCSGVQSSGQHPDKGQIEVNTERTVPGACRTDEGRVRQMRVVSIAVPRARCIWSYVHHVTSQKRIN